MLGKVKVEVLRSSSQALEYIAMGLHLAPSLIITTQASHCLQPSLIQSLQPESLIFL
jgi:hypothetical protein